MTPEQFSQRLARLSSSLPPILQRGLEAGAQEGQRQATQLAGERLKSRSGQLARSIEAVVEEGSFRLRATTPYGSLQEAGGTIRPSMRRFLSVPLTEEARATKPANVPGLFVFRSKAGNLLLGKQDGTRLQRWYSLKDSVTVPGHFFLRDALQGAVPVVLSTVDQQVKGVLGGQ